MSWSKVPHGPPPLLGGAGRNLGHDGASSRASENLRRMRRDEDIPPGSDLGRERHRPEPTPTPAYGENKRKKQIREQEEAAESPDVEKRELGDDGGNWIAGATKNKGGLHRSLGVPEGQKIPAGKVKAAAQKGGKIGKQARLAETLEGLGHDGKSEKGEAKGPHKSKGKHKPPAAPPMRPPMMPPPPVAAQMPPTSPMGFDGDKMEKTMHEFKHGELHSGSKTGPEVTSRKQAIAIGINQAKKAGEKP